MANRVITKKIAISEHCKLKKFSIAGPYSRKGFFWSDLAFFFFICTAASLVPETLENVLSLRL